jgi:oligopeptide/dipeptide ABC transporter ATP-binding protein
LNKAIIQLNQVKTHFPYRKNWRGQPTEWLRAVDGVNLNIVAGECLGLVGESGCGKSTLGRSILCMAPVVSGSVLFHRREIQDLSDAQLRPLRPKMQMVFQDPRASLNPKMTVLQILQEALFICPGFDHSRSLERSAELLDTVDLRPEHLFRYPHEFSGGQQQRICIARALATEPEFIVFDEATSALDVSVQAQVINLMADLQKSLKLTYLFISHDLSIMEQVCHRIAVMYAGRIMEVQRAQALFGSPRHPYTKVLRDALPVADPRQRRELATLPGEVPSLVHPPSGCRFHTRCGYATEVCRDVEPLMSVIDTGNWVRCHHHEHLQASNELKAHPHHQPLEKKESP